MSILIFTGHRIDWLHRAAPRFPVSLVDSLQTRLTHFFDQLEQEQPVVAAVGSLAAGFDLLVAHECLQRNIPLHVFLPFALTDFVKESVNYPKETDDTIAWELMFVQALAQAAHIGAVPAEGYQSDLDQFADCNNNILTWARHLAQPLTIPIQAVAFVQPQQALHAGGSAQFISSLANYSIPVHQLGPLPLPIPAL